jgi:hypothetical protein
LRASASDVTGRELNKHNRGDEYLRQTMLADLWCDPHKRRELQRISTGEIALEAKLSKAGQCALEHIGSPIFPELISNR